MKRIYIAGALNSDACGYIQNLHLMSLYAEKVRRIGCAVYNPGTDFIQGVISGDLEYTDYVDNTLEFLKVCDALAVVPDNYNNSLGVRNEILMARECGIPVLYSFKEVLTFLEG